MKQLWLVAALSAGLHAQSQAEIFRLRSECGAIARQMEQDEDAHWKRMEDQTPSTAPRRSTHRVTGTAHYDVPSNRCYVMLERNLGTTGPNGGVTVWSNFWVSLYDGQTRQEWGNANEGSASNFGWIIGDEKTGYGHAAFERALAWMAERMAER